MLIILAFLCASVARGDTLLIRSVDGGRTWTDVDPGPPHQSLQWIQVDSGTSNLYALSRMVPGGQLLVSTDRGQTWQARQNFGVEPFNSRAAGTENALYVAYEVPAPPSSPSGIIAPPTSVMIAKVTSAGNVVEQYPAEGLTFDRPEFFSLSDLAVDPASPSALFALITHIYGDIGDNVFQALWRSQNSGRNWRRLALPIDGNCYYPEFRIDPSGSPMYLLCGSDIFKSADRGDSWTRTTGPEGGRIRNVEIGPGAPGVLYGVRSMLYGDGPDEVWKSTDAAATWQRAGSLPGVWRLQLHPTNPSVLFAAGSSGIHKSEDSGETWTRLLAAELDYPGLLGIRVDPGTRDTLYGVGSQRLELRLHDRQTYLRNLLGEKQLVAGSLVSIYGQDLASNTQAADSTPLPLSLGGARVLFDGQPAPLLFASPDQINAQVPFGLTGAVAVEVHRADATIDRQSISLSPRGVVILRENPSRLAAPLLFHASDFRRVTANDPARPGGAIVLLAVGMGELEPSIPAGELPPTPLPQLRDPPCVAFSQPPISWRLTSAPPVWAGAAPGLVGVYQVVFEVPSSLSAASYTLSLTYRPRRSVPPFSGECSPEFQGAQLDSVTLEVQ